MKHLTLCFMALLASTAHAGLLCTVQKLLISDDDFKVPGDNPLKHCEDPKDDILTLTSVDVDPNPPLPGKNVTVTATGNLSEAIEKGATIDLQVKLGLIPLLTQHIDLCDAAKEEDVECPISKGNITGSDTFTMPEEIPPAKYTVIAKVLTKDKDTITCVTGEVEFKSDDGKRSWFSYIPHSFKLGL